jgi:hypothetical protein
LRKVLKNNDKRCLPLKHIKSGIAIYTYSNISGQSKSWILKTLEYNLEKKCLEKKQLLGTQEVGEG